MPHVGLCFASMCEQKSPSLRGLQVPLRAQTESSGRSSAEPAIVIGRSSGHVGNENNEVLEVMCTCQPCINDKKIGG